MKQLIVRVPDDIHRGIRIEAVRTDRSMRELLLEELKRFKEVTKEFDNSALGRKG